MSNDVLPDLNEEVSLTVVREDGSVENSSATKQQVKRMINANIAKLIQEVLDGRIKRKS